MDTSACRCRSDMLRSTGAREVRRVRLRRAVEGGLYEHAQPYIRAALMMGVFSCVCSGVLWGRVGLQCRILGGVIVSFLGGEGEGKRNSRARNAETMRRCFAGRCEFRTALCVCYILYVGQRRFHCSMLQAISKSALDLDALGSARALFRLRQPVDQFTHRYM